MRGVNMELVLFLDVQDDLPDGFLPYKIYSIMENNIEVGRLVLREGDDEQRYYDGHIGYTIDEEYRGHSYAYQACLLLKDVCDYDHYIITCDPQNMASKKTIEKLGARFIEIKAIPKHLKKHFNKDEKEKCIYIWEV